MQAIEDLFIVTPDWAQTWRWVKHAETIDELGRCPVAPLYQAAIQTLPHIGYEVQVDMVGFCHVRHQIRTTHFLLPSQRAALTAALTAAGGTVRN